MDGSLHSRARPKPKARPHQKKKDGEHTDETGANGQERQCSKDEDAPGWSKWSWIGQQSPLMQEGNEAEWILMRLFEKLEGSLRHRFHSSHQALDGMKDDSRSSSLQY